MRSMDVIDLFNNVTEGTTVRVDKGHLPMGARNQPEYVYTPPMRPVAPLQHFGPLGPAKPQTAVASAAVPGKKSKKGEGCLAIREPQSGQKSAFRRLYNGSWKPQFFNISANLSPAAHLLIFTSDFGLPGTRMGARNS